MSSRPGRKKSVGLNLANFQIIESFTYSPFIHDWEQWCNGRVTDLEASGVENLDHFFLCVLEQDTSPDFLLFTR